MKQETINNEMIKTINKNKLLTILCAVALTLGVLVSAVLFSVTPVHAQETSIWLLSSNYGQYNIDFNYTDHNGRLCSHYEHLILNDSNKFYAFIKADNKLSESPYLDYHSYTLYSFNLNTTLDPVVYSDTTEYEQYYTEYSGCPKNAFQILDKHFLYDGSDMYSYSGSSWYKINDIISTYVYKPDPSSGEWINIDINLPLPVFESEEAMKNYCLTGDKSGMVSEPELPNNTDETYSFTGFTMNGKTARWTGTTERSFAKEVDVEEYVKVSYAWATTTEPDNLGELQSYEGEFPTSDKQLTLPWSEMEKGKTDFQFIRQVKIFPCYRVPHLAYYIGQPVTIYYNSNGTIDRINQSSIPVDSETIGNDISLIGFRYDSTFHAEWVDVWSRGANKSAFDLGGSEYLSLGVRAVYFDGSKIDLDFFVLNRKSLVWNKAFSEFKENNGSPIKSLYFTPYAKTGVNNPWNKGNSTVIEFDENGNPTSSFDTSDDGSVVHLSDFKLTGVVWNKPVIKYGTITWTGTTSNADLNFIPDSDTIVIATYPRYDSDLNTSYETWSSTTIGKGSMKVDVDYLIDYYTNSELAWNGEMWLTPSYKKGGILYVGEPVIVNCIKGTVSDIIVDEDKGEANQVDKTEQNKNDADSILNVGNQFYSIINSVIGSLQQLPALLTAIFGFLPSSIISLISASFIVIVICRILGR